MASNINPNNIDGSYPVAGQDNNSQGFRDNFTNIKTNFQAAETEINDLDAKVLLKAALTGSTLDNNMNDNLIYAAKIQDFSATRVALPATSGTVALNYASGHYQTVSPSAGSITLSFSSWPASGSFGLLRLQVTVSNLAYTMTLPAEVTVGLNDLAGYSTPGTAGGAITFPRTGIYTYEFTTSNGGSTVTIQDLSQNGGAFLPSSEDLAPSATANPGVTASYFTTSAAETATLAAGLPGQVKVFAMKGDGGDMVITVTNPAWGGAGTITFNAVGQACTLMYISSKWFCIGNNGATFA